MPNLKEYQTIVLAALLHDIGKFLQRGRSLPFDIEGPHPEVSTRFINAFPQTFEQVAQPELLKLLVLHHHRGHSFIGLRADDIADERSRLMAYLVNKADSLSSSERGQHAPPWQDYKTVPLASLFSRLFAGGQQEGILTAAFKAKVPIYCPALGDSSIGIALAQKRRTPAFLFDIVADVRETACIASKSKATGVIYLGGGTPKNFIQQTEVTANLMGLDVQGHRYAVQVTTDSPQWGGLSGCTFEEAVSWGKVAAKAKKAVCYCDATIALPIISHALADSGTRRKNQPVFNWGKNDLKMRYR